MYFQTIERNKGCLGFYEDGKLYSSGSPQDAHATWDYSHLCDEQTLIAKLLCGGKTLIEACPEELKEEVEELKLEDIEAVEATKQSEETFEIEELETEDTISILNRYIEEFDTNLDKNVIQKLIQNIYKEACELV